MAANEMIPYDYSEEEAAFVERFVYDVIVYTLKKCGFPEEKLPPTDLKENVYHRAKFVKIAGVSTLRVALISREKWRQMFVSRRKNSNFGDEEILDLLLKLVCFCCKMIEKRIKQSMVELFLASFNEMALFLHHENIDFNFNKLVKCARKGISLTIGESTNGPNTVEEFFDKFENISGYDKWITNFIKKYAVPYGSREDVSDLFLERIKNQFRPKLRSLARSRWIPSYEQLQDLMGFLPFEIFLKICEEEFIVFTESSQKETKTIFLEEKQNNSEIIVLGGQIKVLRVIEPKEALKSSDYSSDLGIEEDLGQMNIAAEGVFQGVHGAIPKKKNFKNRNKN